jgi:predicted DNA-binding protein
MYYNTYKKEYKKMITQKATFTLPENILNDLNNFSIELNRKKSHLIKEALDMYFDYLDIELAKKRLSDIESGKSKTQSLDDVRKELLNV